MGELGDGESSHTVSIRGFWDGPGQLHNRLCYLSMANTATLQQTPSGQGMRTRIQIKLCLFFVPFPHNRPSRFWNPNHSESQYAPLPQLELFYCRPEYFNKSCSAVYSTLKAWRSDTPVRECPPGVWPPGPPWAGLTAVNKGRMERCYPRRGRALLSAPVCGSTPPCFHSRLSGASTPRPTPGISWPPVCRCRP